MRIRREGRTVRVNAKLDGLQGRRRLLREVRKCRARLAGSHKRWMWVATYGRSYGVGAAAHVRSG